MSGERLTGSQLGILLALMAEAREMSNLELKERFRLSLDGENRRKLNGLKLVDSRKDGRRLVHELTDNGWARCLEELSAPLPSARTVIPAGAIHAVLTGLDRYLVRTRLALADVFQPGPTGPTGPIRAGGAAGGAAEAGTVPEPATAGTAGSATDLEMSIRAVYRQLATRTGAWVRITRIRDLLGAGPARTSPTRPAVDEALRRLGRGTGAALAPQEDQKNLTGADRRDAVRIGGQDMHLLMIEN